MYNNNYDGIRQTCSVPAAVEPSENGKWMSEVDMSMEHEAAVQATLAELRLSVEKASA